MQANKRRAIFILIIILLAIIIGGGLWLMNYMDKSIDEHNEVAKSENNDIKTIWNTTVFTDKFLGYEIRYPKNWIVFEHKTSSFTDSEKPDLITGKMSHLVVANLYDDSFLPGIDIVATKSLFGNISDKLGIESSYNEIKADYEKNNLNIYDEKDSKYRSNFRKREFKVDTKGLTNWVVVIEKENYIFRFIFTDYPDNFESNHELVLEILNLLNIFNE